MAFYMGSGQYGLLLAKWDEGLTRPARSSLSVGESCREETLGRSRSEGFTYGDSIDVSVAPCRLYSSAVRLVLGGA